ncbi:efflux RND transporter periplasmic adaptor subunit [Hyphomicrobium sp. xq]|uniref:Efflux RND transporter periplasmic adaptor subunit n=1 Tax=Hyphomicrobium album TaxID=2665159 RepID=A0A6I3KQF1_9HYPH|nr:efflux RND transporter periplasmic adaptor subunit [Hyphomicrobium album]MTD95796.1 efflux RND transporter periplasmic adaptor subunit [Hyphomicrobium album]
MPKLATTIRLGAGAAALAVLLTACGDRNTYQPPPPAEVTVAKPEQRKVTLYMEVTGSTAAFNRVDLVARVQGFLDKVGYKDGADVKKGDLLFQIDKKDFEIQLQIAEATQAQQEALLLQADADLKRKQDLVKTAAVSIAQVDESRAKRDSTLAALEQAKGQVAQAKRNLDYTTIVAPFDGTVSARYVDPGAMVGAGEPTKLATIVQQKPIYVKFNIDEQQVLTVREQMRIAGVKLSDLGPIPVGFGLQTEQGYPHTGTLDYVAPEIDSSTGTLAGRAIFDNKDNVLTPGLFVRVRIPKQNNVESLLVPDIALGTSQEGRYLLVVNDKNVVEQRQVQIGELVDGGLRIINSGLEPKERVVVGGVMRALPGNTVVPVMTTASAAAAAGNDAATAGK